MTNEELLQRYMYIRLRALQGKADERLGVVIRKLARDLMTAKSRIAEEFRKRAEKLKAPRDADGFFDERADALAKYVAGEIARAAAEEGVEAFEGAQAILSVDGHARNVRLARGLTQEQFEQIATHQPLKQRSLAQWVERCFDKNMPGKVLDALEEGMVMAEGTAGITRRVLAALDDGMAITVNQAAMLARTYVQAANIGAQMAVYKRNEDVIKGYKWLATLDNRTCLNCAVGDGHVYGLHDKRPDLPLHPGCRCLYLPVTKTFRELGLDIDEFKEAERPWTIREDGAIGPGGQQIEQVGRIEGRFKDWYFKLPPKDRARTSIGPTRGALLASGALKWDDMIDFETGQIRTLAEMGFSRISSGNTVPAVVSTGDYAALANEIKTHCSQFIEERQTLEGETIPAGIQNVEIVQGADFLMSTDSAGTIWLNASPSPRGFNAAKELKSAWNKLTSGGDLTFDEEYAVEALWHELTHNRQTLTSAGDEKSCSLRMMETVTQWVARRTYQDLLAVLGGKPAYQVEIKEKGYGYGSWIRNFDSLLERLGVDDDQKTLEHFQNICKTEDRMHYQKAITSFLIANAKKTTTRGAIDTALNETKREDGLFKDLLTALFGAS